MPREARHAEVPAVGATPFADGRAQMQAELRWLDQRLEREVRYFRAAQSAPVDEFRGLYVSEEQVEESLRTGGQSGMGDDDTRDDLETQLKARNRARAAGHLPLQRLGAIFALDEFELAVLLLAAAPELDLRYEVLYSYLNNDVTRKRPNCDLALRLFCPKAAERWTRRRHFAPDAPLFQHGLLKWLPENPDALASSLARAFKAAPRVVDYLLDLASTEPKLSPFTETVLPGRSWDDVPLPAEFQNSLRGVPQLLRESPPPVLVLEGSIGAGRQACAEALCTEMGRALLAVDGQAVMASPLELAEIFKLLGREQRLGNAGLYLGGAEAFLEPDGRMQSRARGLARFLTACPAPVFLACAQPCDFQALLPGMRLQVFRFPTLPFPLRRQLWEREIAASFPGGSDADPEALASQFVLTGGQIRDAVRSARDDLHLRGTPDAPPSTADFFAAARRQSQREMRSLAQRLEPMQGWDDLVLPASTLTLLHDVAAAVRHRHIVYARWGFEGRMSLGKGLKAVFAGPSGTGKTMSAEVMARELQLDIYKIDLSTMVSKYIGETEKNLDRIFGAARSSNAILFFDEADALFGKRSEVKDAHDRYANIEVAYLLQKIEEYEGFVILATNLLGNIDDAFKRRMNFTVEFPFPDERHRERLWRSMFPAQTPLGDDLDFAFLSRQFPISGGNIKTAALGAAFLAAAESGVVQMRHVIQSVAREWQKLGKLNSQSDFKQYYKWIAPVEARKGMADASKKK